ncbi:hypothetical protein U9M48_004235, partial [Paspalum notatum var. saurae]
GSEPLQAIPGLLLPVCSIANAPAAVAIYTYVAQRPHSRQVHLYVRVAGLRRATASLAHCQEETRSQAMAAVLDALVSFVIKTLANMATEEMAMLHGVPGEITKLEQKLDNLKAVLTDAERRRITEKAVQRWVAMLKDVMYEAIDILDICNLKYEERQEPTTGGVNFRCFDAMLFCMQNPAFTHDIGNRIKDLNQKLDSICQNGAQFNFIRMEQNQDQGTLTHRPTGSKTSPVIERSSLVGEKIEEDTVTLVNMLTNERRTDHVDAYVVVAISGTGGIGKTTLARNIYNHQTINDKFSNRIWLSITQACTETELLREAIIQSDGGHSQAHQMSLLEPTLVNTIRDKKIFVVLDDMWTAAKWNNILKASFSYVARGSRVLVTTRDDRVARAMKAQHLHRVNYLGPQDAWSLLKKEVIANERDKLEIDALENIGMEILGRCGGLPLAIKVIGGLLRHRRMNIVEWEMVLNNPSWSIDAMPEELNHAIYLSYDDLPPHLKQCLLYYSLFPPKADMAPAKLIEMWISEGMVSSNYSDKLEQIGADYTNELILRNLIQPYKKYIGHTHYVMHDVVRSFCQYMIRDEALVASKGDSGIGSRLSSQKFRLLSIGVESGTDELEWSVLQKHSSLRTLISFCPIKFKRNDSLSRLSRLRTIHLENADFSPLLADHLGELKHLRYLTIGSTGISSLPDSIGQLKFLQHLCLMGCEKMVGLPNSIVKLKQLRSLDLNRTLSIIPKRFGVLTNLRKITNFPARMNGGGSNGWCTLEELGPLSQLESLSLNGLENVYPSSLAAKAMLSTKKYLGRLTLKCSSILEDDGLSITRVVTEDEKRSIEQVFDELCPPDSMAHLAIDGYFGRRLPEWATLMGGLSLQRLRVLHLKNLVFCTQLFNGLCQLPCLEILIVNAPAIKNVGSELLICHSQHRSRVSASFPSLRELVFIGMACWEEWNWECVELVESMPFLVKLALDGCESLARLPPGLAFHAKALTVLNLLKKLSIHCCSKLQVLEGIPALRYLHLTEGPESTGLPTYLRGLSLTRLDLCCNLQLLCSMAWGKSTYNWDKFGHIHRVEAHADTHGGGAKFTVSYTRYPRYLDTNISSTLFYLLGKKGHEVGFNNIPKDLRRNAPRPLDTAPAPVGVHLLASPGSVPEPPGVGRGQRCPFPHRSLRASESCPVLQLHGCFPTDWSRFQVAGTYPQFPGERTDETQG